MMRERSVTLPMLGVAAAIAITSWMDASGLTVFSALPLLPLALILIRLDRLDRRQIGLVRGDGPSYGLAIAHPLVVMAPITLAAALFGAIDPSETEWGKALANVAIGAAGTVLVGLLTEEGFFRGWLWGSLRARGAGHGAVLVATSLAFAAWHISPVVLETEFAMPNHQVPVYLANAAIIGAVWGMLRMISGSILVASVCHGLWNGLAYGLFGFGETTGALGIAATGIFSPENGLLGLALNLALAGWLWITRGRKLVAEPG